MDDFKYVIRSNTHGNTNRSVYPSLSTQTKMLTSRPTQILAMVLHFLKMCVLLDQTDCHSKELQQDVRVVFNY